MHKKKIVVFTVPENMLQVMSKRENKKARMGSGHETDLETSLYLYHYIHTLYCKLQGTEKMWLA